MDGLWAIEFFPFEDRSKGNSGNGAEVRVVDTLLEWRAPARSARVGKTSIKWAGGVNDGTGFGFQSAWPVDDARRANTAFKLILLVKAEGGAFAGPEAQGVESARATSPLVGSTSSKGFRRS